MRKLLVTAALGVGLSATLLPVAPASAYCDPLTTAVSRLVWGGTGCSNPCTLAGHAYYTADDRAKDLLPDVEFICYA